MPRNTRHIRANVGIGPYKGKFNFILFLAFMAVIIKKKERIGMRNTTLCYITRGDEVLMLHRVKKEKDINKDKWIGVGGKFEGTESPDECLLREVYEETGLTLTNWACRGVVTFLLEENDGLFGEFMYLFTADGFTGSLKECDEGELKWVSRAFLDNLPKWEGDQIFLDLLWQNAPFFLLTLRYRGDKLIEAILDGKKIR